MSNLLKRILRRYRNEYSKCSNNFYHFCNLYIKITTTDASNYNNSFKLYKFQKDIIQEIQNSKSTIYAKARQLGFSNLFLAYSLWVSQYSKYKSILYISGNNTMSINNYNKLFEMYNKIPNFLRTDLTTNRLKNQIGFKNNSIIRFVSMNDRPLHSLSTDLIIFDEPQISDNFEDVYMTSTNTVVPSNGKIIIFGTPNGRSNSFFKKLYEETSISMQKKKYSWDIHPYRDINWYNNNVKMLSPDMLKHVMNANF